MTGITGPSINLSQLSHPSKLFVEVTSRCNITCPMCVKQSPYCGIADGDMKMSTFKALRPVFPDIKSLILNGIGEPLLHPLLDQFVSEARDRMPREGRIGFQTNGQLLTDKQMHSLVTAGLDRISFSLDAVTPDLFEQVRIGADLHSLEEALDISSRHKNTNSNRPLEIGIEYVLQKDNMNDLPTSLRWAASRGVDFALVTHLLAYDESMNDQAVFDRTTDMALAHYRTWRGKADAEGLNLEEYYDILWKYHKTEDEQRLVNIVDRMVQDAIDKDIFFNLKNLLERHDDDHDKLISVMREAEKVAADTGLRLTLPAHSPRYERRCDFIEEGGAFISWDGHVHPCYFLWHTYSCFVTEWQKYVTARDFGTIDEELLSSIWNKPEYSDFRTTAATYDYPFCTNCTLAPCDYIDSETFEQDCFTNTIPCGDCQWCLGLFQCLQ